MAPGKEGSPEIISPRIELLRQDICEVTAVTPTTITDPATNEAHDGLLITFVSPDKKLISQMLVRNWTFGILQPGDVHEPGDVHVRALQFRAGGNKIYIPLLCSGPSTQNDHQPLSEAVGTMIKTIAPLPT